MKQESSLFGPFQLSREQIHFLHQKKPFYVLVKGFFLLSFWLGLAELARISDGYLRFILLLISGFFINGLVQFVHDAWHENLFHQRWQNHFFGHLFSIIFPVLYYPAKHAHLLHHKYNRTEKDPDAYNVGKRSIWLILQYYLVIFAGLPLSIIHFNLLYPWLFFNREEIKRHLCHCFLLLVTYAFLGVLIQRFSLWNPVLDLWIFPILFASPWNGLKSVADHYANDWKGSRFRTATTVRSNRVVSFFWNGLNYHLDHHLFPKVPGYNLPKLHQLLRPTLLKKGSPVFDSYLFVWAGTLVKGPVFTDSKS